MTVRVKKDAPHTPRRFLGREAVVEEEKRLSFGTRWLRLAFDGGDELWLPAERVEALTEEAT